ncbi:MAG: Ig-like domain-containing protein [Gaiellales bacterium]
MDPATCGAATPACATPANHLTEYNLVVNACDTAWDRLTGRDSSNALGQVAVNIGVWRGPNGARTGLKGRAQRSTVNGNTCAIPPTGVTTATGGAMLAIDNQNFQNSGEVTFEQTNERMVAHELGHTLELWHGDGIDNDMPPNNRYDQLCDPNENTCATPTTFMSSTECGNLTTAMTMNQRNTSRAVAGGYTGLTRDPPGTLVSGPNVGDRRPDTPLDAMDKGVDMVAVTMQESSDSKRTSFSHTLFGLINPFDIFSREYAVFADLDGNTATGGAPSDLGFPTGFQGAELVTRVIVQRTGDPEFPTLSTTPTVWRFKGGSFVQCTPQADPNCQNISSSLFTIFGGDDFTAGGEGPPQPDAHVVVIDMPNAVRGLVGAQIRIQAIARQQLHNAGELDRLPDEPAEGASVFVTVPPVFPECGVTPSPVEPGRIVTVEANRLIPNGTAKVFLGDQLVANRPIDGAGKTRLDFRVPIDSRSGLRLVTVGVMGTGLTADCFVEVLEVPPIILSPEASSNEVGEDHTVTATVRDANGNPRSGVLVTFSIDAGPNAGATGECSPDPDCSTDANGMVSFTYAGDGGRGVDEISASFVDDQGSTRVSNTALKFWDADCNENDIADTCDVDCGGFDGKCREVVGCGGSSDVNGDGVPDECNLPPDCSSAAAKPNELWPPNHKFKPVNVLGVSDPDGDSVSITIISIFQDEPLKGAGSGNTCPDGKGVGTNKAQVRAERAGTGDGRVYHIGFTADDRAGGTCTGEVTVCVPHDQGQRSTCVDGGALFDSTVCP